MNFDKLIKDLSKVIGVEDQKVTGGLRCSTYTLNNRNKKAVVQIYLENTKYQARKKTDISNLLNKDCQYIPEILAFDENGDSAYLITEYKEGRTLSQIRAIDKNFSLEYIADEIAETLNIIHNIKNKNGYGWIGDNGVIEYIKFEEYIKSEIERLSNAYNSLDESVILKINKKSEKALEIIRKETISSPVLCWYDINPENILITKQDNEYKLSGFLDPGGARYGIPEWDFAFLKLELCKNQKEYDKILEKYKEKGNSINENLVDALSVFVEMDDIAIQINDKIIFDIPYSSDFKEELKKLHEKIQAEGT